MLISIAILAATLAGTICDGKDEPKPKAGPVELDVSYTEGGEQQKLDLYLPKQKDFATVVFTYGGGWQAGSRKSVTPIGEKLQGLGFGCALLSHRLSPKDKFPRTSRTSPSRSRGSRRTSRTRAATRNASFWSGTVPRAHLSLLLATEPKYLAVHKLSPADIAGVVGLSTPVDLEPRKSKDGFGDALMDGRGADAFLRDLRGHEGRQPDQHVTKSLPRHVTDRRRPRLSDAGRRREGLRRESQGRRRDGRDVSPRRRRNHMAVVRSLLEDKSPIQEQVLAFLKGDKAEK